MELTQEEISYLKIALDDLKCYSALLFDFLSTVDKEPDSPLNSDMREALVYAINATTRLRQLYSYRLKFSIWN